MNCNRWFWQDSCEWIIIGRDDIDPNYSDSGIRYYSISYQRCKKCKNERVKNERFPSRFYDNNKKK